MAKKPTDSSYDEKPVYTDESGKDASLAMEREMGFRMGKYKLPKPRPKEIEEKAKRMRGLTDSDKKELDILIDSTTRYKDGGLVDRKAIRGKTRGKIC